MSIKKIVLLSLGTLLSLGIQAQEIREVTVEKPGKLEKLIKKELGSITRLKISGNLNCEDITILSQMPNLQYIDLRDINFIKDDKHNDGGCHGDVFMFHGETPALKDLILPAVGFTSWHPQRNSNINLHVPFGFEVTSSVDKVFIYGDPNKSNLQNQTMDLGQMNSEQMDAFRSEGWFEFLAGNADQMQANNFMDAAPDKLNAMKEQFIKEHPNLSKYKSPKPSYTIVANDAVVIEKKKTADAIDYTRFNAPIIYIAENSYTAVKKWNKALTLGEFKKIDEFIGSPFPASENKHYSQLRSIGSNSSTYNQEFNSNIITSLVFSDRCTSIPEGCFSGFTNLRSIKFGSQLEYIGEDAFIRTKLTNVDIPESVTYIGRNAFGKDKMTFTFHSNVPPEPLNLPDSSLVYIPDGSYLAYIKANGNHGLNFIDKKEYGSFKVDVPEGKKLLDCISEDNLLTAEALTITGTLKESDIDLIKKAKRLRSLDITNCSPASIIDELSYYFHEQEEKFPQFTVVGIEKKKEEKLAEYEKEQKQIQAEKAEEAAYEAKMRKTHRQVEVKVVCTGCSGTGLDPYVQYPVHCGVCGGKGYTLKTEWRKK